MTDAAARPLPGLRLAPFVAGRFTASGATPTPVVNPWSGEELARVAPATPSELEEAVAAARRAFDGSAWPHLPPMERGRLLAAVAERLDARREEIAAVEAINAGKPFAAALKEVEGAVRVFSYYSGAWEKVFGDTIPFGGEALALTLREPLGVVAQITPWNFPLLGASWKLAPAFAAGCASLLKPAPQTPLSALLLAEICREAGIPDGVLSVLPGGDAVGEALVGHPDVDGVAFTGSTAVGSRVMTEAAGTIKKLALELGGKNAAIVFADADLGRAATSAVASGFGNAGQSCSARSRLLVERAALVPFLDAFVPAARRLAAGPAFDRATSLGPLISAEHRARVAQAVRQAEAAGAEVVTGGAALKRPGFFFAPTILIGVAADNPAFHEEIFGPVCSISVFDTEEEAVSLANAGVYGLSGSVWSRDGSRALRVARALRIGMVAVNGLPSASRTGVLAPFGGYKRSGLGRELGLAAFDFYTETKSVFLDLSRSSES